MNITDYSSLGIRCSTSNACAPGSVAVGTHAHIWSGRYEHAFAAVTWQDLTATGMLNVFVLQKASCKIIRFPFVLQS